MTRMICVCPNCLNEVDSYSGDTLCTRCWIRGCNARYVACRQYLDTESYIRKAIEHVEDARRYIEMVKEVEPDLLVKVDALRDALLSRA